MGRAWFIGILERRVRPPGCCEALLEERQLSGYVGRTRAVTGTTYFFRTTDKGLLRKFWHNKWRPYKLNEEQTLVITEDLQWTEDAVFRKTMRPLASGDWARTALKLGLIHEQ